MDSYKPSPALTIHRTLYPPYPDLQDDSVHRRWAIFDSTLKTPWTYRNITTPGNAHCTCECQDIDACIRDGKAPIKQSGGLATQHLCGKNVENFMRWQEVRVII